MLDAKEVVAFWREAGPKKWFRGGAAFDRECEAQLSELHVAAASRKLDAWQDTAEGALALLILLDQIPRNIFRGTVRAYATDPAARATADRAMAKGFDQMVPPAWRKFFYMPLHHSESAADQRRSIELMQAVPNDPARTENIRYAGRYLDIIERFGRFPHRNAVLGRESTPEELAFLEEPESQLDLLKVKRPEGDPPCR